MSIETKKKPTEQEIRRNKESRLFQTLLWSGALEPAEFDSEGKARVGKIRNASQGNNRKWSYLGGTNVPGNGEPAVLRLIFLRDIAKKRAIVSVSYDEEGVIWINGANGELLFEGKLYEEHKLNPDLKPAIDVAFQKPTFVTPYKSMVQRDELFAGFVRQHSS